MAMKYQANDRTAFSTMSLEHKLSRAVTVGLSAGLAAGVIVPVPVLILQLARGSFSPLL